MSNPFEKDNPGVNETLPENNNNDDGYNPFEESNPFDESNNGTDLTSALKNLEKQQKPQRKKKDELFPGQEDNTDELNDFYSNDSKINNTNDGDLKSFSQHENLTREEVLNKKERELKKREKLLKEREKDMELLGPVPNWPVKCWRIAYHSIKDEIPPHHRSLIKKLYTLMGFTWICLIWNFICCFIILVSAPGLDYPAGENTLWTGIFMFFGIPGAWRLWYRNAYYACRDDKNRKWVWFFMSFAAHIAFVGFSFAGIGTIASTGIGALIKLFDKGYQGTATCVLILTIAWGINLIISIVMIKKCNQIFRGKDKSDLKQDVAKALLAP